MSDLSSLEKMIEQDRQQETDEKIQQLIQENQTLRKMCRVLWHGLKSVARRVQELEDAQKEK